MKIYLDGLFYKSSGIGRYYETILKELAKRDIYIITSVPIRLRNDFEKDFNGISQIEPVFVNYERFSIKGFFLLSSILKSLEDKVDLFFFPHVNTPSYIPKKSIVTVHDLIPLTTYWKGSRLKRGFFNFFLRRSVRHSKYIICISKTVQSELVHYFGNVRNKTSVIYEFINDKFVSNTLSKDSLVNSLYILFVGNRKKHKNIGTLIKAFDRIKQIIPHKLVIAGTKDAGEDEVDLLKNELQLQDRIIEFLSPDDDTIINLYANADLFVFPSLFEGFGLPPLEAVALNTPVIMSDIPILKEIFGASGYYFDPLDLQNMADKILEVLTNKELKQNLLGMQKERLSFFNKDKIIEQHLELFYQCVKNSN
jgi:glycosyltransferase involved in cell wall biosynthesis